MAMTPFNPKDKKNMEEFRTMFGPQQIDHMIRQAIQFCWMALPPKKRNAKSVDKEIRRLVERALKDFSEDSKRFGVGKK